jgi:hypothetical protein
MELLKAWHFTFHRATFMTLAYKPFPVLYDVCLFRVKDERLEKATIGPKKLSYEGTHGFSRAII